MSSLFVAVIIGSNTDWPIVESAVKLLKKFNIRVEARVLSAHRSPQAMREYVRDAEGRGCQLFIAGAGMAAHLAGAVAAMTLKPVIGIPIATGDLGGLDALLSTVQMPGGVPVATVAIGEAGAKNAAYLALQILALSDEELKLRLADDRQKMSEKVECADRDIQARSEQV